MTRILLLVLLITSSMAAAQVRWTITKYEWRDRKNYDKYIKPEQWINKTITFYNTSLTFDFKGIQDLEKDIDYHRCELTQPIDTVVLDKKEEAMFQHNLIKHSSCNDSQLLLIEARPNCYKYPFRDFMVCDKVGFIELMGVVFTMRKE